MSFIRISGLNLEIKRMESTPDYRSVFNYQALWALATKQAELLDTHLNSLLPCIEPMIYEFLFQPGVMEFCTSSTLLKATKTYEVDALVLLFLHQTLYNMFLQVNWLALNARSSITVRSADFDLLKNVLAQIESNF